MNAQRVPIVRFLLVLTLLVNLIPIQVVYGQQQGLVLRITQVDNSGFPQVTVYVSVTSSDGLPVTGCQLLAAQLTAALG